ncbi:unnamed protein product [Blepharisma stoltei]|uniref:Translin-associated factor X-interacting protein 1 N-terminal domain-containing protein n=1 Tax=Blepharisma stoltei TaxID=1481888 RepID=A0AAU9KC00_9CILI|nr:unnamed protein product [Blepharisma stoltei]
MFKAKSSSSPKYFTPVKDSKKFFISRSSIAESPKFSVYNQSSRTRSTSPYNSRLITSENKKLKILTNPPYRRQSTNSALSNKSFKRNKSLDSCSPTIYLNGEALPDPDEMFSYTGLLRLNNKYHEELNSQLSTAPVSSKKWYQECKKTFTELISRLEPLSAVLGSIKSGYEAYIDEKEISIEDQMEQINDLNEKLNQQILAYRNDISAHKNESKFALPERIVRENATLGKKITELEAKLNKMMKRDKQYEKLIQALNLHGVPVSYIYNTEVKNKMQKPETIEKSILPVEYNKDSVPKLKLIKSKEIIKEPVIEKEHSPLKNNRSESSDTS